MGEAEAAAYLSTEFTFMGRCGEEAFLIYYDLRCCARDALELPEERAHRVELIDTWNMIRDVIAEHAHGRTELRLPAQENMAVLAVAEP